LEHLTAFQDGLFYVQDVAARLAVTAAGILPGQRILDCCAAPGGKSFAAAIDLQNRGEVISCDIHAHKIKLLEAGRDRLGLDVIKPLLHSATEINEGWISGFDVVITDVPCSGLAVIAKKPEIRNKSWDALKGLPSIQSDILENVCRYVAPGGALLYSTCTVLKEENEDVVNAFLQRHAEFVLEKFNICGINAENGMHTFWPNVDGTDGFFAAKLRKIN
jgi:16S rRNA (cytosine967-C5)-methyltransferase